MPHALTGIAVRPPIGGALLGYLDRVLRTFAQLFESSQPQATERAMHWFLLLSIIAGAGVVRFWGLGAVGLHGDEETMAMAVRGILEQGAPILPSGMFYPRGLTQLGLMSLSISLFGDSEWALRLPSVLCGIALVPIGYFVGRRFLRPNWSIGLAAALAFLPELIVYSQTARMYIFLVTFVAVSMACTFAWERTGRPAWLIGAMVALIFGLEMHSLAIASVLMLLFPAAATADLRKLMLGTLAMLGVLVGFISIEAFVNAQYPEPPADFAADLVTAGGGGAKVMASFTLLTQIAFSAAALAFAVLAIRASKFSMRDTNSWIAAALLIAGLGLQLLVLYHLAAICYTLGLVLAVRAGAWRDHRATLIVLAAGVAALALMQAVLIAPQAGTFVRVVGAMTGQPSVWPYARIAAFSLAAGVMWGALLVWGLSRFAVGKRAPDFWLIAVLGAWCPLFALGMFTWDTPPRYTSMALIPMLLCAFAFGQKLVDAVLARSRLAGGGRKATDVIAAAVVALCVINVPAAAATVNAGYSKFPDHKGAAAFMREQRITDEDVVLVEDILQQTYYLGPVDYWLIGPQVARRFVMKRDDAVVDFYTGTPVVVTPEMLEKVLQSHRNQRIYIVGTGEGWVNGSRPVRDALEPVIESDRFETVFVGRDGLTRVYRAVSSSIPPRTPAQVTTDAQAEKVLAESAEDALEDAREAEATAPR